MNELDEEFVDDLLIERDAHNLSAPAGSPLARARMRAHQQFDPLWKEGWMSRKQAYRWLARMMCIPVERCHFVMFSEGDCKEAIRLCRREVLRRIPE